MWLPVQRARRRVVARCPGVAATEEEAMKRIILAGVALVAATHTAHAFCGFYVSPGEQPLLADATQVVLMRKGTRTVLSMQNNYKGPPEAFAMVIPVPAVLHEA